MNLVVWQIITICAFGEVGEMVTKQFGLFNTMLGQCNWYLYPLKMQQMLVIFTLEVQQPTHIRGFGNRLCARDTFKRVNLKTKKTCIQFL